MARSDINKEPSGNKSSGALKVAATHKEFYVRASAMLSLTTLISVVF